MDEAEDSEARWTLDQIGKALGLLSIQMRKWGRGCYNFTSYEPYTSYGGSTVKLAAAVSATQLRLFPLQIVVQIAVMTSWRNSSLMSYRPMKQCSLQPGLTQPYLAHGSSLQKQISTRKGKLTEIMAIQNAHRHLKITSDSPTITTNEPASPVALTCQPLKGRSKQPSASAESLKQMQHGARFRYGNRSITSGRPDITSSFRVCIQLDM
ncbi:hypothetical protein NA56DRAFT_705408 [Hyaloscypha hepaticicola]|uniref:Uncharacterized protein n=1 Tax=Hyaloscypha hepaticicola TaxID=2082293 RepID=A0A2J6Q083_9HELO|nr:hypothetical protein NA56DRAFT_705408 [Hyaloscypha hepaticicola]